VKVGIGGGPGIKNIAWPEKRIRLRSPWRTFEPFQINRFMVVIAIHKKGPGGGNSGGVNPFIYVVN
jgi:hypothetical protein